MKFRMILAALLLPAVVLAQQPGEKPKSAPSTDTNASLGYSVIVPANGQNPYLSDLYTSPEQSKIRVNLNLRNAPLKEAIKQLSEQTKQGFVLESDVPADARVTVVAKNIRLSTALDLLTDATDLIWNQRVELKWPLQASKKPATYGAGITYHIGKNLAPYQQNTYWSTFAPPNPLYSSKDNFNFTTPTPNQNFNLYYKYETLPKKNDSSPTFNGTPLLKGSQKQDGNTGLTPKTPYLSGNQPNYLLTKPMDPASTLSSTYTLGNTLVSSIDVKEVRSTFTCPNCKQQVTVIHKHESPKCEKCGRVFHDDWQFCPFDGAKRPAGTDTDWQFCPICGERIKPNGKADTKPNSNSPRPGGN